MTALLRSSLAWAAGAAVVMAVGGCYSPKTRIDPAPSGAVLKSEFIYEVAPFPSCHASTIAEGKNGLVTAWFGGKHEKNPDVAIWVSRYENGAWSAPVEVANGIQPGGKDRVPCWNPVLHQPKGGPLLLFYKVGPSPSRWWGMMVSSTDGGKTWSTPHRLPDGFLGPIKNKPVTLPDGTLLCPSSTEHDGWRLVMERTRDLGQTWETTGALNDGKQFGAIQPTVLFHPGNRLQLLCRTRQNVVADSWSTDGGKSWSALQATSLPNPNSGIDGVTLKDGQHLLVYNPTRQSAQDRTPLVVGASRDGKEWKVVLTLESEPGEYSYPAIIQTADGLVHVTYTWKRKKVRHAVVDPAKL